MNTQSNLLNLNNVITQDHINKLRGSNLTRRLKDETISARIMHNQALSEILDDLSVDFE